MKNSVEWGMYQDPAYYGMYAVRPVGDTDFNSPRLFHFVWEKDAKAFLELVEKSVHAVKA